MKSKITVKTESLPERCDICHQIDLFDPLTGDCTRCKDAKALAIQCDLPLASTLKAYAPIAGMPLASTSKRFANLLIDSIISRIVVISLLTPLFHLYPPIIKMFNPLVALFAGLSLNFLYYFLFEAIFQKTPAKFITGTKVVNLTGSKPTPESIAIRTIARFVPFEVFSRNERTWWHDRWTDTRVVDNH